VARPAALAFSPIGPIKRLPPSIDLPVRQCYVDFTTTKYLRLGSRLVRHSCLVAAPVPIPINIPNLPSDRSLSFQCMLHESQDIPGYLDAGTEPILLTHTSLHHPCSTSSGRQTAHCCSDRPQLATDHPNSGNHHHMISETSTHPFSHSEPVEPNYRPSHPSAMSI
jgi:hypothetical protein